MTSVSNLSDVIEPSHGGWIWRNEPYRKEPVLRALREAGRPLRLREVTELSGVASVLTANVLRRAVKKGLVRRIKTRAPTHAFCRKTWTVQRGRALRLMWLYYWVGD